MPECEKILWRHLDGCPHCDIPNCVVLATIKNYHVGDKIEDEDIDNCKGRRVLASTQVLQELVERLLQQGSGGTGLQDSPGSQGPKSDKGDPGIDTDLTHICAINWVHGSTTSLSELNTNGLLIAFDRPVRNGDIHRHSFMVLTIHQDEQSGRECWCELPSTQIGGVQFTDDFQIADPIPEGPDEWVNGAQFKPAGGFQANQQYRVVLKGDFIKDKNDKALDANHLPPWLPTCNKTGDGVAGGTFESWFTTTP